MNILKLILLCTSYLLLKYFTELNKSPNSLIPSFLSLGWYLIYNKERQKYELLVQPFYNLENYQVIKIPINQYGLQ